MKKTVVGIFGTWDMSIWSRPEDVFREKLAENHIHPFTETAPNRFMYEFRSQWFWIFLFGIIVEIIGVTLWYLFWDPSQFISFAVLFFVISLHRIYVHKDMIKIIIDLPRGEYYIVKKGDLTYRGLLHNIYIRLIGQNSGSGEIFFKIVLNGYNLAPQDLTSSTVRKEKLEKLGRRLASRLGINYFDWTDKSTRHVIRHRSPFASSRSSSIEEEL
ncbi:cation channel sperm-associated auxiliary subunit TMEM249-like [Diadema setosum]|uniref:cation channel sperm-associated auxiliary subunit TMEM249-like n=1 Tax=Diadema setosum TaxID=31175 RepID=UPI003B3B8E3D